IVWSLELHRQMFQKKALAQNFSALANQDVIDLIKNKRVAFTSYGPDYASRFVGDDGLSWDEVGFAVIPAAKDYKSKYPTGSPAITFQWAFVVPKNAKNRDMSWNFIRFVSTKDGILNQALSGNNPVRKSTYDLAEYKSKVHFVEVTRNIFNSGRKLFPGFESFSEVRDILGEEIQRAVLGEKTAAQALADAQKTTGPLIK
ncbi:MAG TPA: extracellular solute-binding protein, partial [Spirochaetia bacterium]|nr:extracellular solute-binding protein [Spirochaetia bacterium]